MSRKESRKERLNQEEHSKRSTSKGGISKVYYIVIGILFLVLIGLVIVIFSQSGKDVAINDEASTDQVEQTETPVENTSEIEEEATEEPEVEEPEATDEPDENSDTDEETSEEEELTEGESETISEDAPHDPGHTTDFSDGSGDRVNIKNQIVQATGLGDDLIEWWIANDGPGRVVATVSDRSQSEYYDVYLQYGDGSWHVTSYQRVSGN